jgi:hypothetical protein
MAKQNRTTLKSYFEVGDTPSQAQYSDLIDSSLVLDQANTGNLNVVGSITSSANISASTVEVDDQIIIHSTTGNGAYTYRVAGTTTDTLHFGSTSGITHATQINGSKGIKLNSAVTASGGLLFLNLPTSDPGVEGAAYNDGGTLKISTG